MNPISNIDELSKLLKLRYDGNRLDYLPILLLNPNNLSNAGELILNNYEYLNSRTGGVNFYIPGLSPEKLKNSISTINDVYNHFSSAFKSEGFNEFLRILESMLPGFIYGEGTELIVIDCNYIRSHITNPFVFFGGLSSVRSLRNIHLPEESYARIDLDSAIKNGKNAVGVLSYVAYILREKKSTVKSIKSVFKKMALPFDEVKIFIAGSTLLTNQRNTVKSEFLSIQNRIKAVLRVLTFEDFDNGFTENGPQFIYHKFIQNEADYVVFILDGKVGGITMEEFEVAMSSFEQTGHPNIYVYNKVYTEDENYKNDEVEYIKACCTAKNQYYTNYKYDETLSDCVYRSFFERLMEK